MFSGKDIQSRLLEYRDMEYDVGGKVVDYGFIREALKGEFGYDEFKSPEQELVTLKSLNHESVFGVLATGSGKSTVFLLPAFLRGKTGVTLVVSPLRALMDMFDNQKEWVDTIHGEVDDRWKVWDWIAGRKIHLLLVAPETLRNSKFKDRLVSNVKEGGRELDSIVLDEVHCVSGWGHEFRPEYWWVPEHLFDLEERAGGTELPRVMLTATANKQVEAEISDIFGFRGENALPSSNIIRGPAARPEIYLSSVICKNLEEKFKWVKEFLNRQANRPLPRGVQRRVLVYTQEAVDPKIDMKGLTLDGLIKTKSGKHLKANVIAKALELCSSEKCSIEAKPFSSRGMSPTERKETKDFFHDASDEPGQIRAVVATSAFGMGMDYERIPGVLHFYPRSSLTSYWQQVGRSGRGFVFEKGEWAEAMALYSEGDLQVVQWRSYPPALEGVINSFTIPALGLLVAWENPPGSGDYSLRMTESGKLRKYVKYLTWLQEIGVLGKSKELGVFPKEWGKAKGYVVNHDMARKLRNDLFRLAKGAGYDGRRYRKYTRMLSIAGDCTPGKIAKLDQFDFSRDRFQTVLVRLNLWSDIGALERDFKTGKPGVVVLDVKQKELTRDLIGQIIDNHSELERVKESDFYKQRDVLEAETHYERCRVIHEAFLDDASECYTSRDYRRTDPDDKIPGWL